MRGDEGESGKEEGSVQQEVVIVDGGWWRKVATGGLREVITELVVTVVACALTSDS